MNDLTERALKRFANLVVTAPKAGNDDEFINALKLFADEHAGRIDEAVAKLEALNKDASTPSRIERVGRWIRGWTEFSVNAGIEASVNAMLSLK